MGDRADAAVTSPDGDAAARGTRRTGWRRVAWWVALVALVAVLVPVTARLTGWEAGPLVWLVALMPWVALSSTVPLAIAVLARSWTLSVAALSMTSLCAAWIAPLYVAAQATGDSVLTVATANLEYGEADADAVVRLVDDYSIDVLAVQELTPGAVAALSAAGLDRLLPHAVLAPESGYTGTGLWSRLPLDNDDTVDALSARTVRAQITVGSEPLTVYAVHPAAPGPREHAQWADDLARLASLLGEQAGGVLVVGDFNTTRDHQAFRRLEGLGYVDGADEAGAGFLPTFPQGRTTGPLVAIDHVMTRDVDLVAKSVATVTISDTDHWALVVEYAAS